MKLVKESIIRLFAENKNCDAILNLMVLHVVLSQIINVKLMLIYILQLYVTVLDVNDNPPVFNSSRFDLSVLEESAVGTIVGIVTATDIDADAQVSIY